jgi:type I restriction enzyme S subunit
MSNELPNGWAPAPLDFLCERLRGVSYARDEASIEPKKGSVPILRANNIQCDRLIFDDLVYVPANRVNDAQRIRKGDVVIAMSSGSKSVVGKTAQALEKWDGGFGAFCGVLRSSPELNSRYVGLFLQTRDYRHRISELSAGTNINNLKAEHFSEIEVPVAPLAEQRRIVAKLEELLYQVEACQRRLVRIPRLLKRFRQAVLAAACSGRLTADWREENSATNTASAEDLPDGWSLSSFGDVLEGLKYGTSTKCGYERRGAPVLRIPNIVSGKIDQTDLKFAVLPARELNQLRLTPGDILLIRSNGSVSLVGRSAIVSAKQEDFAYAGYLIRLRPNRAKVEPEFLNFVLDSYDVRLQIELEARSTSGVNNINSEEVQALRFLLPPVPEQQEIVRRVERFFALADRIEARFVVGRKRVDSITQAILAKAFRGELVPTEFELAKSEGRSFESAEELLKRIKGNGQVKQTKTKRYSKNK